MQDIQMTFDELLTMKALQFKASLSGRTNSSFASLLLEKDETQAEAIGMKNMCFRVNPLLQARFEVSLDALGMSKQEALTEALQEFLNKYDDKLRDVGIGPLEYDDRLKELGFALSQPEEDGLQYLVRVAKVGE